METIVYRISKEDLISLYAKHHNFETFGRLMAEQILQRATDTAMYLAADKPEERFQHRCARDQNSFSVCLKSILLICWVLVRRV